MGSGIPGIYTLGHKFINFVPDFRKYQHRIAIVLEIWRT